jgi:hypothetical protein
MTVTVNGRQMDQQHATVRLSIGHIGDSIGPPPQLSHDLFNRIKEGSDNINVVSAT